MKPRSVATAALLVTAAGVLYTVLIAATGSEPTLGWLFQAGLHLGELLVVIALALLGTGRIFLGVAAAGQLGLAVAEVVWPSAPGLGDTLFDIGPILTAIGLIGAGIAIVRAGRWTGWRRFVPLIVGIYVVVVMLPAVILSGGPPALAALVAIAGWDVLWALTAVAVLGTLNADHEHAGTHEQGHAERDHGSRGQVVPG